jgi:ATP-dependent DNA ligase
MPFRRRATVPPPPPEPADWRPQPLAGRSFRDIPDPVVEPGWGGVRVIARVRRGPDGVATATLTDEDGIDATPEFEAAALAIGEAALADELILDGYLTVEPTQPTEGLAEPMTATPPSGQIVGHWFVGGKIRLPERERKIDPSRPIAFVAVDLLLIDGTPLVDLPLIERKRLLDGALSVGELVRITPYARPPIGSLAATWHAIGFRTLVYKSANGRYQPTGRASDWARVPIKPT